MYWEKIKKLKYYVLVIVIVIIIYNIYISNAFLNGSWVGNNEFTQRADIDEILLAIDCNYLSQKCKMIIFKDNDFIEIDFKMRMISYNPFMTKKRGKVFISDESETFPKTANFTYDLKNGYLNIYDNDKTYLSCVKYYL